MDLGVASPSHLSDTLSALRESNLGRLRYDRDWETQGRVQEIISDVRARLTSLSIEPVKSDQQNGESDGQQSERPIATPRRRLQSSMRSADDDYVSTECDYVNQLESFERERKEKVRESIVQHARELDYHMKEMEEDMSHMRLMRQRHLLSTLKRIQGYKDEYESFITELTSRQKQASGDDAINSKMREVENKHRKAMVAQRIKTLQAKFADISAAHDECIAVLDKVNATEPTVQHYVGEKRNQIRSHYAIADGLLSKSAPTEEDCLAAEQVLKQLQRIKSSIPSEVENAKKVTSSQPINLANISPIKPDQSTPAKSSSSTSSGSTPLKEYIKHQAFLTQFEKDVDETFIKPVEHKPYRLSLQSFIRTTINTISGESTEHLRQKYQRLNDLLSGRTIEFQDKQIRATNHPSAMNFCYSYIAKTFISVGIKQVLSLPKAAFPMGAIIAILWQLHPTFGRIFMAHLVEKCPYVIGYFPTKDKDDTDITYLIACGYAYGPDNETLETEESFLNRMKAITRIYAAVMQSSLGPDHPHGLPTAWTCISRILNTEPRPGITPSILHALLTTVLYKLLACYKGQVAKLVTFIHMDYIARIEKVSEKEVKKQSIVQLKMFVEDALKKMRRNPTTIKPEGVIGDYFFQKSYLNAISTKYQ